MKTIIIEDDILNIDLLQSLIQRYFPKINITAICNDVDTAIEAVFREQPELIFLDIWKIYLLLKTLFGNLWDGWKNYWVTF